MAVYESFNSIRTGHLAFLSKWVIAGSMTTDLKSGAASRWIKV